MERDTTARNAADACVRLRCSARDSLVPLRDSLLNAQRWYWHIRAAPE